MPQNENLKLTVRLFKDLTREEAIHHTRRLSYALSDQFKEVNDLKALMRSLCQLMLRMTDQMEDQEAQIREYEEVFCALERREQEKVLG